MYIHVNFGQENCIIFNTDLRFRSSIMVAVAVALDREVAGLSSGHFTVCNISTQTCASVIKQYTLLLALAATKVNVGLPNSKGSLVYDHVTCTACHCLRT